MKKYTTSAATVASDFDLDALVSEAWDAVGASFERFCVIAGISSLQRMMGEDAAQLAGQRYERNPDKPGYRWGTATGMVGFHGGRIAVERLRVRDKATGRELPLPSWEEARDGGFLEQWATTLMLMNVSTRKFGLAVRLPEAAVPAGAGSGLSKSAVSRRFKVLTEAKFMEWMSSDLSGLDLLVIQIDGLHMGDELLMIGAIGVDSSGKKHPLGVVEGATENAVVVQALLDNLIEPPPDQVVKQRLDHGSVFRRPLDNCAARRSGSPGDRAPRSLRISTP